jgi:DNA-binding MarR family transcriptional regulator
MRKSKAAGRQANSAAYLHDRPGFLIRRAHQIATSVFVEVCRKEELTPSQYGVLYMLQHEGPSDQSAIALLVGLDRSTTGLVIRGLAGRGLLRKQPSLADRRRSALTLTPRGHALLLRCEPLAEKAKGALLAAFTPAERREFLRLLKKFTSANNHLSRARVGPSTRTMEAGPGKTRGSVSPP